MSKFYQLPDSAVPVCINDLQWLREEELSAKNIRVSGRVSHYDPVKQVLEVMEPLKPVVNQDSSTVDDLKEKAAQNPSISRPSSILVDTSLIGSLDFHCRKGTPVLCVGEIQMWQESRLAAEEESAISTLDREVEPSSSGMGDDSDDPLRCSKRIKESEVRRGKNLVLKATICRLFEGLDYEKYCRYVEVVRQRRSLPS